MEIVSDEMLESYRQRGVIRIPALFKMQELTAMFENLGRYLREVVPTVPESDRVFEKDGVSIRNLWRMNVHDGFFNDLGNRPDLLAMAARLANGPVELGAVEMFCKPALVGSAVPPHQDNAYFCRTPPDVFTLWIALDPVTLENGAVHYLAGSHGKMLPHIPSGVAGNSMGLEGPLPGGYETFVGTLSPGDALCHHCQTIHYSEPNRSDRPRRGMLIVYMAKHSAFDPALMAAYDKARPPAA